VLAHLAPLAGRGRSRRLRVRGSLRVLTSFEFAEAAPHPNPLPARAGRGRSTASHRPDCRRRAMTVRRYTSAISRRVASEFLQPDGPPKKKRAQGKPGARCTRGLACKLHKKTHTSIQVQRRQSGLPCAVGYGLFRALPGDRAFLPPSPLRSFASRELDTSVGASGPHDFTVRHGNVRHSPPSRPPHPTARS
jgi:hypothetical protein